MSPNTYLNTYSVQKRASKKKVTLSVRADLVGFAKREGINMSQLLEEALLNLYFQKSLFLGPGPGFEPGLGDPQAPHP